MYLDEGHPLHVRRTLDQFYYHTLLDTEKRDGDQTCIRYYNHKLVGKGLKPVLTMVDQLWLWLLPECGGAPPTVITAFPQRSNRIESNKSKAMTALVSNILGRCSELTEWSAGAIAQVIVSECSRIYFDTMSNRHEMLQFSEIYETSIGEIVSYES